MPNFKYVPIAALSLAYYLGASYAHQKPPEAGADMSFSQKIKAADTEPLSQAQDGN